MVTIFITTSLRTTSLLGNFIFPFTMLTTDPKNQSKALDILSFGFVSVLVLHRVVFTEGRTETPCKSLANPKKLSFPSVCLIQSCRTECTVIAGPTPSSCILRKQHVVIFNRQRKQTLLSLQMRVLQ